MNGTKLVVKASSLLLAATARARCVFVQVAVSVRLSSPRALRRNAYIYQASLCNELGGDFVPSRVIPRLVLLSVVLFPRDWAWFCNDLWINFTTRGLLVFGLILLLPLIFWASIFGAHLN